MFQGLRAKIAPVTASSLRRDERQRGRTRRAENPFDIGRHAEPARAARPIGQHEARNLDRSVDRHVLQQDRTRSRARHARIGCSRGRGGPYRSPRRRGWERRRAPQVAGVVVAQIEGFAASIADGVVRPRRDLILATVDRPGVAAALGSRLEAERRIGDDVDPRRGRRLARPEDRHILASVSREAAESVEEFEVGRARPRRRRQARDDALRRGSRRLEQAPGCARAARTGCRAAPAGRPARRKSEGPAFRPG